MSWGSAYFKGDSGYGSTPTIVIPQNGERARVPIDPALAIFARFGGLAK